MLVECIGSEQSLFRPFFHYWAVSLIFLRNEHYENPLQRQPFNRFISTAVERHGHREKTANGSLIESKTRMQFERE